MYVIDFITFHLDMCLATAKSGMSKAGYKPIPGGTRRPLALAPSISPSCGILFARLEQRRPYEPRKNVVPLAGHHVRMEEQQDHG